MPASRDEASAYIKLGSFGYKKIKTLTAGERRRILDKIFVELTKQQKDEIVRAQLIATLRTLQRLHSNKNAAISALFGADADWLKDHSKGSVIENEHASHDTDDDDDEKKEDHKPHNKFTAPDDSEDDEDEEKPSMPPPSRPAQPPPSRPTQPPPELPKQKPPPRQPLPTSYYDMLGVKSNASMDEIRQAFRRAARTHHPDKGGDEEDFKKLNHAYDTLTDPLKRTQYNLQHGFRNGIWHGAPAFQPQDWNAEPEADNDEEDVLQESRPMSDAESESESEAEPETPPAPKTKPVKPQHRVPPKDRKKPVKPKQDKQRKARQEEFDKRRKREEAPEQKAPAADTEDDDDDSIEALLRERREANKGRRSPVFSAAAEPEENKSADDSSDDDDSFNLQDAVKRAKAPQSKEPIEIENLPEQVEVEPLHESDLSDYEEPPRGKKRQRGSDSEDWQFDFSKRAKPTNQDSDDSDDSDEDLPEEWDDGLPQQSEDEKSDEELASDESEDEEMNQSRKRHRSEDEDDDDDSTAPKKHRKNPMVELGKRRRDDDDDEEDDEESHKKQRVGKKPPQRKPKGAAPTRRSTRERKQSSRSEKRNYGGGLRGSDGEPESDSDSVTSDEEVGCGVPQHGAARTYGLSDSESESEDEDVGSRVSFAHQPCGHGKGQLKQEDDPFARFGW